MELRVERGKRMLNKIVLMGRLTKDPELRRTQSGTAVASFSIAVDRDYDKDAVDFIDCVAWRGTAEFVCKHFSKGRMIAVQGKLQIRPWTDKEGHKRTAAEVVCENIYFADSKKDSVTAPTNVECDDFIDDLDDSDIPF